MESEADNLIRGVMALIVLSAIPVVSYAIWLDYFETNLRELMVKQPDFDKETELEKVRFLSLMVLLFQFTLFLGSDEIRRSYPLICGLTVTLCVSIQVSLQLRAEKSLHLNSEYAEPLLTIALKAMRSWFVAASICGFLSIFGVLIARYIGLVSNVPTLGATLLMLLGGSIGMSCGLILNFALAPYHLLKILPTTPLKELPIGKNIQTLFEKNGMSTPKLWLIELQKLRIIDILITGFRAGRGPFTFSLFLSRFVLNTLNSGEIQSLLLIEVSHLKLKHFQKRVVLISTLTMNSLIFAILVTLTVQKFFPGRGGYEFLGTTLGLIFLVSTFRWTSIQKQNQEFEADAYALDHLNLEFEHFSNALRKLDYFSVKDSHPDGLKNMPLMGFPETERRIFLLSIYLKKRAASNTDQLAA